MNTIGRALKKSIRSHFDGAGMPKRVDNRSAQARGFDTAEEYWMYLEEIRQLELDDARAVPWEQLEGKLEEKLKAFDGFDMDRAFNIKIKSGMTGQTKEIKMNNMHHFGQFMKHAMDDNHTSGSENWLSGNDFQHVWETAAIDSINWLAGGGSTDNDRNLTFDLEHYCYEVFSPKNQKNDCAFR